MHPCRRDLVGYISGTDGERHKLELTDLEPRYILDEHVTRMRILSS